MYICIMGRKPHLLNTYIILYCKAIVNSDPWHECVVWHLITHVIITLRLAFLEHRSINCFKADICNNEYYTPKVKDSFTCIILLYK